MCVFLLNFIQINIFLTPVFFNENRGKFCEKFFVQAYSFCMHNIYYVKIISKGDSIRITSTETVLLSAV